MAYTRKLIWCNFCGKESAQVAKLVAGPEVAICDECILQCYEIIDPQIQGNKEYDSWCASTSKGALP